MNYYVSLVEAAQAAHCKPSDVEKAIRDGLIRRVFVLREDVMAAFTCFSCGALPDDRGGWEDGPYGTLCPDCGESMEERDNE